MSKRLFESIKCIIKSGIYYKDELIVKIETLRDAGRLSNQEVVALQSMM